MLLTICAADLIIRGALAEAERRGCQPLAAAGIGAAGFSTGEEG